MLNDPLAIVAAVASAVVAGILIFGILTFARGGEYNRLNANKIMRWRLMAQFVAVVLIAGLAWLMSKG
ncbi:twin transmembrane helix small protein [Pseudogemmobacter blasticus]|uniref:Twin transmembrane helix small protein n=1 Tax=Fuscovulum blasticum DSM 2131 TaxID=1188250 RepID=A0A2T4JBY8_FUSBL|nr:twin transmembrane helix small protein [Fuscovulum blasticum]AWD22447.1 hypothetical protein B6K69_12830 [Fuscovulum blasticum]PTE15426.1 twin transmembrane helix small protein [Fuscovulum blasticum DSM 2131]